MSVTFFRDKRLKFEDEFTSETKELAEGLKTVRHKMAAFINYHRNASTLLHPFGVLCITCRCIVARLAVLVQARDRCSGFKRARCTKPLTDDLAIQVAITTNRKKKTMSTANTLIISHRLPEIDWKYFKSSV